MDGGILEKGSKEGILLLLGQERKGSPGTALSGIWVLSPGLLRPAAWSARLHYCVLCLSKGPDT